MTQLLPFFVRISSVLTSHAILATSTLALGPRKSVTSFGETHVASRLSANAATAGEVEEQTEVLIAYDELSSGKLSEYFRLSVALGSPVAEHAELVRRAFVALRRLIKIAPHTREPGPKILKQLLEAIEEAINEVKA